MVIDHGHAMVVSVHGTSVCLRQADQKHRIAQALLADAFRWMRSTGGGAGHGNPFLVHAGLIT